MSVCLPEHEVKNPVEQLFEDRYGLSSVSKATRHIFGPPDEDFECLSAVRVRRSEPMRRLYVVAASDFTASLNDLVENEEEHRELIHYLDDLRCRAEEEGADPAAFAEAKRMWKVLRTAFSALGGQLQVPNASTGPDGKFLLFWRREPHYLEIEFYRDGAWSLFYEDMSDPNTFRAWDYEGARGEHPPLEALRYVDHFVLGRRHRTWYAKWTPR